MATIVKTFWRHTSKNCGGAFCVFPFCGVPLQNGNEDEELRTSPIFAERLA
jgi:hypothetical protein